jgi:Methyltransferase domain
MKALRGQCRGGMHIHALSLLYSTRAVARQPQSKIFSLIDRYENGRRYSGYREYWAPNDEKQNNQLDIAHHLYVLMLDHKLFLAPIDIGTGTGIWAMDFADKYPSAQVIGFDLSPVQPGRAGLNVRFEIKDACDPDWGYKKDNFGFIHVRGMAGCISDWPVFYHHVPT